MKPEGWGSGGRQAAAANLRMTRHETRLMFGWAQAVGMAVTIFGFVLVATSFSGDLALLDGPAAQARRQTAVTAFFELIMPAMAVFCLAQAPTLDWEEDTAESVFCLPGHGAPVFVRRTVAGLGVMLAAMAAMISGFEVWVYPFDPVRTALLALPPALFVAGLAMLVGTVTRSYAAAVAAGFGFWIVDRILPGQLTGPLYLFRAGKPAPAGAAITGGPGLSALAARIGLEPNRWLLFGTGCGLIVLAALAHGRRIRCGRGL